MYRDCVDDGKGGTRTMYQEEWQILADWENSDQMTHHTETSVAEICMVFFLYILILLVYLIFCFRCTAKPC